MSARRVWKMSGVGDHAEDMIVKKGTKGQSSRQDAESTKKCMEATGKAHLKLELERQTSGVAGEFGVIEWVAFESKYRWAKYC
jgi:hypothetical protein